MNNERHLKLSEGHSRSDLDNICQDQGDPEL